MSSMIANNMSTRPRTYVHMYIVSVWVLCGSPVWPSPPVVGPLWGPPLCVGPLFGSPVWVPFVGPLCVGPLCGSPVWIPCMGPSALALRHVASTRVMSPARSHAPAYIGMYSSTTEPRCQG